MVVPKMAMTAANSVRVNARCGTNVCDHTSRHDTSIENSTKM